MNDKWQSIKKSSDSFEEHQKYNLCLCPGCVIC